MAGGISSRGMEALEAMTSDLDIYRAANELIKQHGGKAPIHAAMRADELLAAGAMDGKAVPLAASPEGRW